jgi:hypothetical protein
LPPFRSFTQKYQGRTNRIVIPLGITPYFDPADLGGKPPPFKIIEKKALWDTGATNSVITAATAKELNLIPVGSATVNHAGGQSKTKTYMVNYFLPNNVAIPGVLVTEMTDSDFNAIIGMDIITMGDLSVTNVNSQTWISFRIPSVQTVDYVQKINKHQVN